MLIVLLKKLLDEDPEPNETGSYDPGYLAKYNADWTLDWHKFYKGRNAYVTEAVFEGDDILASYHSTLSISDDDETFNSVLGQGSMHLHRLNNDGNEISPTISAGKKAGIVDITKVADDRYLILILDRPEAYDPNDLIFLNYDLSDVSDRYLLYMFDVSGDLFESVSIIEKYLAKETIKVFPNPVQNDEVLTISLPKHIGNGDVIISATSINGIKEYQGKVSVTKGEIKFPMDRLSKGSKILSIQAKNQLYTTQIIIN